MTAKIVYEKENPFIEIDGELFAPAMFRSFRPYPANIQHIYRTGIRLYQMIVSGGVNSINSKYSWYGGVWNGPGKYDFSAFDEQIKMFMKNAPEGYFCVQITLDAPKWWLDAHPEAPDSYSCLGQAVFCEEWKHDAAEYLRAFIEYAEEKYGDRIFSYSFTAGWCTEFFCEDNGRPSPEKKEAYRAYCGDPCAEIPDSPDKYVVGSSVFRASSSNEYRYLKWATERLPELINFFGAEAQKVIKHNKLLGIFLGYIDMSCPNQNTWLTNAYEECWKNPDFDMIYSPAAYKENRFADYVSSFQLAVDSLAVNGKLYLHEIDHRTELAAYPRETGRPMWDVYETQEESIQVLRRELAITMAHHASYWWFDFMGCYYNTPEYEKEFSKQLSIYNRLSHIERKNVSEIAVFVDPMSFLNIQENSNIFVEMVRQNIDELWRCGAPFDLFNLNDLPKLDPDKYKLYIFLNAINPSENIVKYIKETLCDKYKFFVGAPGYARGAELDAGGISDFTGIKSEAFETDKIEPAHYLGHEFGYKNGNFDYKGVYRTREGVISPLFHITDPDAEILARYDGGKTAYAYKNKVFYSAVGNIPYKMFMDAAERAGVHIYLREGHGLAVTSSFIAVNTIESEACSVTMPEDCRLIDLYDEGHFYRTENRVFTFTAPKNTSKLFLIRKGR
ncbi:MAG: hypothetical protein ACI4QZ_08350 [Eubacteriales bacterium]